MRQRGLPPLDLLVPFEAAARLGSFTLAAEELSVTQSAISQRVRSLERILDTALFIRHHRAIELTDQGRELFNGAKFALQHLSAATHSIRRITSRQLIKLSVDTSIGSFWLIPRLKAFLKANGNLLVELSVSDDPAELLNADVVILHGDGKWPGFVARRLFRDKVFPVCTSDYLARNPISSVNDLLSADLIDLDYKHWNWMNWGIWLAELGFADAESSVVIRTTSYPAQIEAARAGMGIALAWGKLTDDDLQSGKLVRPVTDHVETGNGYYVLLMQGADENAHALAQCMFKLANMIDKDPASDDTTTGVG